MFTGSVPWVLKACTVCAVMVRVFSAGGAAGRPERVLAPVAFLTLASVLPSILSSVIDRVTTTAYIMQSALFLLGVHVLILGLERWHLSEHSVAATQTCLLHMLWSQFHALERRKHVLVYQGAVQLLVCVMALVSWSVCMLMLPHLSVDIFALGGLMFAGEVLGVVVSLIAGMVASVGNLVEAWLTEG